MTRVRPPERNGREQRPLAHDFSDNRAFLRAYYLFRKAREARFSYQKWAEELGYRTPGFLCNALNGKRSLRWDLLERVIAKIEVSPKELQLLRARAIKDDAGHGEAKLGVLEDYIDTYSLDARSAAEEEFMLIRDWYHLVILELVQFKDFRWDAEWIAAKVGRGVSPFQVDMAIKRLLRLGYLESVQGRLTRTMEGPIFSAIDKNVAFQEYHRKSADLAKDALHEIPAEKRDFNAYTIAIQQDQMPELRRIAKEFCTKLLLLHEKCTDPDKLMRINVQAFPLVEFSGT